MLPCALGAPTGPKTVKFSGETVRSLSPDERSAGALIKKVLDTPCGNEFREAAEGISMRKGGLERLMTEHYRLRCWMRMGRMSGRQETFPMHSCSPIT